MQSRNSPGDTNITLGEAGDNYDTNLQTTACVWHISLCLCVSVGGSDEENTDEPSGFAMWPRISMKSREKSSKVPLLAC